MKYSVPLFLLSAGSAAAHSGHDEAVLQGSVHWLTSGDHLVVILLAACAVGLASCRKPLKAAWRRLRRSQGA